VPRFRGHTIIHPVTAKYGRVKIHAYPMTSGSGIRASKLMESICRLAGLENIGIKVSTHILSANDCPHVCISLSLVCLYSASMFQRVPMPMPNYREVLYGDASV
jgi:hypothetical protein